MSTTEKIRFWLGRLITLVGFLGSIAFLVRAILRGTLENLATESLIAVAIGVVPASLGFWMSREIKKRVEEREVGKAIEEIRTLARKNFGILSLKDIAAHDIPAPIPLIEIIKRMESRQQLRKLPDEDDLYQIPNS